MLYYTILHYPAIHDLPIAAQEDDGDDSKRGRYGGNRARQPPEHANRGDATHLRDHSKDALNEEENAREPCPSWAKVFADARGVALLRVDAQAYCELLSHVSDNVIKLNRTKMSNMSKHWKCQK